MNVAAVVLFTILPAVGYTAPGLIAIINLL
jgi:hypothetical protein